ncbi:GIY-YIG nuclease family protein [Candidatus Uhrbacteria bacterium]|nr:GIY-YIG nuclease family protein [Candidatus Uhrbacteria bacterium]
MVERTFAVYIMANESNTVTYTGVTNDLVRRAYEHREKLMQGFTSRYRITKLVYYEFFNHPSAAIAREKQIKGGSRAQKVALIKSRNPTWRDLYDKICS